MGHTLAQWQLKVSAIVRDARIDADLEQIESTGLRPAFAQFSIDRPRMLVTEVAGDDVATFDLPVGWVAGFSSLESLEFPARETPAVFVDRQAFMLVRSAADPTVEQILFLDGSTPAASQYVRFWFTAPWPYPTNDVDDPDADPPTVIVDQVNDIAYEAVAALAASLVCTSLSVELSRRRGGTAGTDFGIGDADDAALRESARTLRGTYMRFLGIDPDAALGAASSTAPASRAMDFDPSADSLFHGGRR